MLTSMKKHLEALFDPAPCIAFWERLLRFPSISADPAHDGDCRDCATWLRDELTAAGLQAECLETGRKPVVYAEYPGAPSAPTVLVYGHYDVQPVDPVEGWETPPFEPSWRDDRLYARGAQDNKGQLAYVIQAVAALIRANELQATVKVILEGEEECGSKGLTAKLGEWKERLQADILMVCDTGTVASGQPTIIMGLRGVIHMTATIAGPDHDLHSGLHGGLAPNPAQGAAQVIASLFNPDGSVAVPGFMDGVAPPTPEEQALAEAIPFDPAAYRAMVGTDPVGGTAGASPQTRVGFLPSLDINGIHSGYGGAGSKTVLPSDALIKLSVRLVPGQNPDAVLAALEKHIEAHVPPGLRVAFPESGAAGPGFRLSLQSQAITLASETLEEISGAAPAYLWEGASIPIVVDLAATAGADPLLVGFGHERDRIHAPNESFSLDQFRRGFLYATHLLQRLR